MKFTIMIPQMLHMGRGNGDDKLGIIITHVIVKPFGHAPRSAVQPNILLASDRSVAGRAGYHNRPAAMIS